MTYRGRRRRPCLTGILRRLSTGVQVITNSFTRITTGHSPRRQFTSRVAVAIGLFLSHNTQTPIVEAVNEVPDHPVYGFPSKLCLEEMPNYGMMLKSWLKIKMPTVINTSEEDLMHGGPMYIIHSIVPYESRKRTRDSDA